MYSFSQYYCWGHEVLCSVSVSSLNMQSGSPGINLDETLQFFKPPRNTWECVSECGERRWLKWWDESRGTCEVYWWLRCRHRQQHSSIYTNTISSSWAVYSLVNSGPAQSRASLRRSPPLRQESRRKNSEGIKTVQPARNHQRAACQPC